MATAEATHASRKREGRMTTGMPGFYRTFAGPAIIGVSVWCATGVVAVLSAGDSGRVVLPAPWWVGVIGAMLAFMVPAWRTRPWTTLPALFSTLPWWPVPLPAVALLWTGPLAWLPIAAALLVAAGYQWMNRLGAALGAHEPGRATRLAALASLVLAAGAAWAADARVPGGDEPHYLVITQSLLKDGDLQIENNHANRDYASYFGGTINPDYLARGRDNAIYSIHAPGVSALVLPAFAVLGFRGAQATMIVLFAICGALMWRAAWRLTADASAAWFAWAAVAGSATMAVLSFMIFPETPGAAAVAAGVWLLVSSRDASNRALLGVGSALAALPWLHTRFSILAGAIGLSLVITLLTDPTRASGMRWRRGALFMLVPAISAAAWLGMFYVLYGTVDPRVPYGPNPELRPWIWGAVAGLFVDQQFGLLAFAPVLFIAFLGPLSAESGRSRVLVITCIAIVLIYAMAVASYWMWWAGVPALPARFLMAALPLLVLPLAVTWSRSAAASRALFLALLLASFTVTTLVLGIDDAAMAWNDRRAGGAGWLDWLNPLVNVPRAWPSFFWDGERAFLIHAFTVIAVATGCGLAIRIFSRRYSGNPAAVRMVVAVVMLTGLMVIAQAGWIVTASAPLAPARAQLALHAASAWGRAAWRIGSGVAHWDSTAAPLQIQRDRRPPLEVPSTTLLWLTNVPPGLYRLDVTSGSAPGGVSVRIARSAPLQRFTVASSETVSQSVSLPAGATVLTVDADTPELAGQLRATLVPQSPAYPGSGLARQHNRFADVDAFFVDANVFPEIDGFWVRGSQTTRVVLSQGPAGVTRPRTLDVRNGSAANTVTIRSGGWQEVLTLAPGEARAIALPLGNALGAWPLTITSSSGFRPSDTPGGDRRFLGAWIALNR
jgi:hypothetical protein